jgi:hypothetical protein
MFTCPKCGEQHKSLFNSITHQQRCRAVMPSDNPLDCNCTYNTHRPYLEGTRTDVTRNPKCPVHHPLNTKEAM